VKPAPRSLKARALQYLALREHSRGELRRKLLSFAATDETPHDEPASQRVDALLDWLEAHKHLSEQRFVESRVHARAARFGNLRIRQELAQHQVAMPPAAAQALVDSELQRAREVWRRKFDGPAADAAGRAKQARFLTGRGFSAETVRAVLREAGRGFAGDDGA
jgi:regulatory protein